MDTVFLLCHTGAPDGDGEGMLIGVFRTEQDAKDGIIAVAGKPGFIDYPGQSLICPYELGKLHWTEGFAMSKDEAQG